MKPANSSFIYSDADVNSIALSAKLNIALDEFLFER